MDSQEVRDELKQMRERLFLDEQMASAARTLTNAVMEEIALIDKGELKVRRLSDPGKEGEKTRGRTFMIVLDRRIENKSEGEVRLGAREFDTLVSAVEQGGPVMGVAAIARPHFEKAQGPGIRPRAHSIRNKKPKP